MQFVRPCSPETAQNFKPAVCKHLSCLSDWRALCVQLVQYALSSADLCSLGNLLLIQVGSSTLKEADDQVSIRPLHLPEVWILVCIRKHTDPVLREREQKNGRVAGHR